jgi:hypothetical protein
MERLADDLPIEPITKRRIVACSPDEALSQITPHVDAGVNHLVFHGPGHNPCSPRMYCPSLKSSAEKAQARRASSWKSCGPPPGKQRGVTALADPLLRLRAGRAGGD